MNKILRLILCYLGLVWASLVFLYGLFQLYSIIAGTFFFSQGMYSIEPEFAIGYILGTFIIMFLLFKLIKITFKPVKENLSNFFKN